MNGIDFMVRDQGGWLPPVPLPRRRLRWVEPKAEAIKPEEIEFILASRGRLTTYDLGECYGVSPQTISNVWAAHQRSSQRSPRGPENDGNSKT